MRKYRVGEEAPPGTYLNTSTWEIVPFHGETTVLPGRGEAQCLKVPAALAAVMGPFAGLALIVFLPFVGIVGAASLLAYRVGLWTLEVGRRAKRGRAISAEDSSSGRVSR